MEQILGYANLDWEGLQNNSFRLWSATAIMEKDKMSDSKRNTCGEKNEVGAVEQKIKIKKRNPPQQ